MKLMLPYIVIGALLVFPIVLGLFLRVSASHIFFSVMAGELLGRYFASDAEHALDSTFKNSGVAHYGELMLLVVPMLLTALFLKGSISRGKAMLHVVPLAITGVVFTIFAVPLLEPSLQEAIRSTFIGQQVFNFSNEVIGVIIGAQLIALWLLNRGEDDKKKRKR